MNFISCVLLGIFLGVIVSTFPSVGVLLMILVAMAIWDRWIS